MKITSGSRTSAVTDRAVEPIDQANTDRQKIEKALAGGSQAEQTMQLQAFFAGPNAAGVQIGDMAAEEAGELLNTRLSALEGFASAAVAAGDAVPAAVDDLITAVKGASEAAASAKDELDPGMSATDVQQMRDTLSEKDKS